MQNVNILGTIYTIEVHNFFEDKCLIDNNYHAYCDNFSKLIVISDLSDKKKFVYPNKLAEENAHKRLLRHEIVHAFLYESGLDENSLITEESWAVNEEMVDWVAVQSPKILEAFKRSDCLK